MNKPNAEAEGKWKIEFIQFFVKLPSLDAFICPEDSASKMGNFEDIRICWGFSFFSSRSAFGRKCSVRWFRLPPRRKGMISMCESNLTCCFSFEFMFIIRLAKGCFMIDILSIEIFRWWRRFFQSASLLGFLWLVFFLPQPNPHFFRWANGRLAAWPRSNPVEENWYPDSLPTLKNWSHLWH